MGTDTMERAMSFEQFRSLVAQELGIPEEPVTANARFLEDLQADSVQLVDLFLRFEEQGMAFPLEAAWQIKTVGDAYEVYSRACRA